MNKLLDRFAVLLICLLAFGESESAVAPVVGFLISCAASATVQLLPKRNAASAVIILFATLCGAFPILFCAVPLMLYDALCEKRFWLVIPAFSALFHPGYLNVNQLITVFVGSFVATVIYFRMSELERELSGISASRDKMAEKSMNLYEQNSRLSSAQDSEIHLAALKERNRIAREIHDNVGHLLTRSILQAGALAVMNRDENLAEPISSLKDTLDLAMTGIRSSVHDLHDNSLDLKKIIADSIRAVEGRFDVRLEYDLGDDIPGNIKLCMAGVVKESLSNAAKHSNGDRISVILREHPGFYQLMVEDNGKNAVISENGIGLSNMEERADSVGGRISFTPSEKGFRVFMSVPKEL